MRFRTVTTMAIAHLKPMRSSDNPNPTPRQIFNHVNTTHNELRILKRSFLPRIGYLVYHYCACRALVVSPKHSRPSYSSRSAAVAVPVVRGLQASWPTAEHTTARMSLYLALSCASISANRWSEASLALCAYTPTAARMFDLHARSSAIVRVDVSACTTRLELRTAYQYTERR